MRERDAAFQNQYPADMRTAQQDWEEGHVSRLYTLLGKYLPEPERPDVRGWEWYYWLFLCRQDAMTLRGHGGWVRQVAWHPDGRLLASAAADGTVRLWDTAEQRELGTAHRRDAAIHGQVQYPTAKRPN